MRLKKILIALGMLAAGVGGLWIAGPPPLATGVYAEAVTATSAVLAKVDPSPRCLVARVWEKGVPSNPMLFAEDVAACGHAIDVTGLRPATRYGYRLEADGVGVGGGEFRTAPAGDDRAPIRFAAVGDSGQMPWWWNMHRLGWSRLRPVLAWTQTTPQWDIADWIAAQEPHFFLHLGDLVYWPRDLRASYEDAFFRPFGPLLRDTPIYTLIGNHDIPRGGGTPPFESLFHNPVPSGIGRPGRNFTAAWGAVRLVAFDVVDPEWERGPALAWLERTLAAATEPWLIAATHVPCASVYARRTEDPGLRDRLWARFARHGVDLVLSGDDHHYVRHHARPAGGPVQVTIGTGGKSLYDVETADPRIAASAKAWGFVLVEVRGLRLDLRCLGSATGVLDTLTIDRRTGPLPARISAARGKRILELRR